MDKMSAHGSKRSMGSNDTASSGSVVRARAKAEALKVRAAYAAQEAKLKMEKAAKEAETKLETTIIYTELEVGLLTIQREADEAIAEAQAWESAQPMVVTSEVGEGKSEKSVSERSKMERTNNYVQNQIELKRTSPSQYSVTQAVVHSPDGSLDSFVTGTVEHSTQQSQFTLPRTLPVGHVTQSQLTQHTNPESRYLPFPNPIEPKKEKYKRMYLPPPNLPDLPKVEFQTRSEFIRPTPTLNVNMPSYVPRHTQPASTPNPIETLAQYLVRRDLVNSGLYQFDDKLENYCASINHH